MPTAGHFNRRITADGSTHASNLKRLCRLHHLLKTFWTGVNGWRDKQLPDGTGNLLRHTPACIRRQLGKGEHVIPSDPVVNMAHGDW